MPDYCSGLLGAGATLAGGPAAGVLTSGVMSKPIGGGNSSPNSGTANANPQTYGINLAHGGLVGYCGGGMPMKQGGAVPGQAQVPGDSAKNDTVHAQLSPGEVVIPRTMVQSHPEDIAALLQAMKHLRGAK